MAAAIFVLDRPVERGSADAGRAEPVVARRRAAPD
jgi:hypothetical protein